jgi:uncharacterized membrane protein YfcA
MILKIEILNLTVGRKIVTGIDQEKFKKMVLIAIILVSIKFILDGITANL